MIATASPVCPNCGAPGGGRFCAECGQKNASLDPTLRDVAGELVDELANVDGRLFRSLRLLLLKPGVITREHFEGRRARYLAPLRLYLLTSVLCFAVLTLVRTSWLHITCSSCAPETRPAQEQAMGAAFASWTPRAMFVLVPVFAGLVGLAVRRARRNYPQHLYFALHVHAAWFFALALFVLGAAIPAPYAARVFGVATLLYCGQYLKLALARAYDVSPVRSAAVTTLLLLAYAILVVSVVVGIVAWSANVPLYAGSIG
jgi:hypothetical protein